MSNVKNYDVGQINLDLLNSNTLEEPPYVQYTHELPLLSLGDVLHNMNLSLVFNYERYRDEKANGKNPFFIAPGFKLNLHKRLIYNQSNVLSTFQGEDGKIINLKAFGNTYAFDDESQRILRKTQSVITVEHSDFSKENYNESGRISSTYDKYGNAVLSYAYNTSGQLTSVTFRGSKTVTLGYVSNRLNSITYNGKTINFVYKTDGTLNYVQHYTGVKYIFTLSKVDFADQVDFFDLHESDFEVKAVPIDSSTSILCSKKLKLLSDRVTVDIIDEIGTTEVNRISYKNPINLLNYGPPFKYVDIIDNNGVETRTQLENGKIMCSYEIENGVPRFEGVESEDVTQDNDRATCRFVGNIALYNTTDQSDNNKAGGVQTRNSGIQLNYNKTNYQWETDVTGYNTENGYYTLSGWIKSNTSDVCDDIIRIANSPNNYFSVNLEPVGQWKYFSYIFPASPNILSVSTDGGNLVSTRDLRITFQETKDLSDGDASRTSVSEYVLINDNREIPIKSAQFYYSTNSGNFEISSNNNEDRNVTFSDVLKFKLRKKRDGIYNEVYYNKCKNIFINATDLKVLDNGIYVSISNFDLGVRVYSGNSISFTRINIDENNQTSTIVKTCTVTKQSGETTTSTEVVSTETLDNNLDVITSTVDGITTEHVRNAQGLVTNETVNGLYTRTTTYGTNNLGEPTITVTDEYNNSTVYTLDNVWGVVKSIELPDNTVITDTYDDGMSALITKAFDSTSTRKNIFNYADGRLNSVQGGNLEYVFGYDSNTGDLSSVSKNDMSIEHHEYNRSNGKTTVLSEYPSENSALHTETKVFDKYGRLESVAGVLENLYRIGPRWTYLHNGVPMNTMEEYNIADDDELIHSSADVDGKDAMLSQNTDRLASEVTRYGYANGKLTATVTKDLSNNLRRQETFVYDNADRLATDRFDYNPINNEYVTSDIGYVKEASDPAVDNRVSNYSYKINGTEKAKTENSYDTYKRIKIQKHTVAGKTFTKSIRYDQTRIDKVVERGGDTSIGTLYQYDSAGRINSIDSGVPITYIYDSYGQLIRENNATLDKTFIYEYNNNGGITKVKEYAYTTSSTPTGTATEKAFTYDSTYPDKLTRYGNENISYNSIGCPTTYNGYTATWTRGKLSKLTKGLTATGMHTYNYSYNAFGQRIGINYVYTSGTSSSVAMGTLMGYNHMFFYDQSGRLICEHKSSEYYGEGSYTEKIVYLYDETGIIGMVHTTESGTTTTYYFQRNLLGDVMGIYTTSGTKVGGYAYDAWGNCTITLNTNGIAAKNPIRYRGYYYDEVSGLYYLNARYYSPTWRRFISPTQNGALNPNTANGLNLYSYANNNPIGIAYSGSGVGGRSSVEMISSLTWRFSITGEISSGSNSSRNMVPVPSWMKTASSIADPLTSFVGPIRTSIYAFTTTNLWDLMRLDGVDELPGILSKSMKIAGYGFAIFNSGIVGYEKYASGASNISALMGAGINACIGIGSIHVSTLAGSFVVGSLSATALSGGWIILLSAGVAYLAGTAVNHILTKLEIGGNTIEGHLNNLVDWLIWWD